MERQLVGWTLWQLFRCETVWLAVLFLLLSRPFSDNPSGACRSWGRLCCCGCVRPGGKKEGIRDINPTSLTRDFYFSFFFFFFSLSLFLIFFGFFFCFFFFPVSPSVREKICWQKCIGNNKEGFNKLWFLKGREG